MDFVSANPEPFYKHSVFVWIPEVTFDIRPICIKCGGHTQSKGYSDPPAWRVLTLSSYYYILARCYTCLVCPASFFGTHPEAVKQLPIEAQLCFPALLTHRSAIHLQLLHLLKSLVNNGLDFSKVASVICEAQKGEHARLHTMWLAAMSSLKQKTLSSGDVRVSPSQLKSHEPPPFSDFDDRNKYGGYLISGMFIDHDLTAPVSIL